MKTTKENQAIRAYLEREQIPAWQKHCKGKGSLVNKGKAKRKDAGFNS